MSSDEFGYATDNGRIPKANTRVKRTTIFKEDFKGGTRACRFRRWEFLNFEEDSCVLLNSECYRDKCDVIRILLTSSTDFDKL